MQVQWLDLATASKMLFTSMNSALCPVKNVHGGQR